MYPGERFNSITHIIGSVLAIVGAAFAIHAAVVRGRDAATVAAVAIYGFMLIFLYLSSTLYHSLRGKAKRVFHVFDHCAIYLLIAGVLKDVVLHGRYRPISVVLYVLMGWLVIVAIGPLRLAMPPNGIFWIAVGGVVYTAGIVFFALSKRVAYAHGVWHLCVIGGSACHYVAIMRYVAV